MLRMKTLLLLAVTTTTLVLAGCNGTGEAEIGNNGVGATPSADATPPSMPTGLTAAAAGSTGANLSWSASTDNVAVTGYIVRRNGVQVATSRPTQREEAPRQPTRRPPLRLPVSRLRRPVRPEPTCHGALRPTTLE